MATCLSYKRIANSEYYVTTDRVVSAFRSALSITTRTRFYASIVSWSSVRSLAHALVSSGSVLVGCNSLLDLGVLDGS